MPSTRQYLAGARAVLRKDGVPGVKRFYERHGVVFGRSEDGRLNFIYDGADNEAVVTAIALLGMRTPGLSLEIAALSEQGAAAEVHSG